MDVEFVFVVGGLSLGGVYALLVLGLVLTYRVSKFLNLAHGAIAMVNTYVYWDLTSRQGWPTLVAAIFCLFILAPIVGVVIGTGLFGRLSSRDDSTKIAGSVALIVILNELVFKVWNGDPKFVKSVVPAGSVAVGDSRISSDQMAPIIVAGLVAAGLLFFLTVSGPGKALRAIAENPELAAAYSIDVTRLQALGWAMSTMLATAAGILIAPLGSLSSFGLTFLVISGLTAATVGRLVSIPWALAGSVLLGILTIEFSRLPSDVTEKYGSLGSALPFLLLSGALIVFIVRKTEVGPGGDIDQTASQNQVDIGQSGLLRLREVRRRQKQNGLVAGLRSTPWIVGVVGIWAVGATAGADLQFNLTLAAIWTVVFSSMTLLNGLGGQVSLCQATFMGIGALAGARYSSSCSSDETTGRLRCVAGSGTDAWVSLLVAAVAAALVGLIIAAAATRVKGIMLAVATLSFGFFVDGTAFTSVDISNGSLGFPLRNPAGFEGGGRFWLLCLLFATGSVLILRNVSRSRSGRVLRALEQSPTAVAALGFRSWAYRLGLFGLSAGMAGVAGMLFSMSLGRFGALDFQTLVSLLLFVIIYAVGTRRTFAPVIAGLAYVFVPKYMAEIGFLQGYSTMAFGVLALLSLGFAGGFVGATERLLGVGTSSRPVVVNRADRTPPTHMSAS
ncbi:ABC transporter permease subunit [Sporichthya polymorpha]|uniref:branched-chain amino acid ABC transporter permease n=1 Tax=Sporichthya polymorpha TaxID=35751 RepID=UPI000369E6DE|nr:ABC transporter permease [Sporichthya polymorpha]